MLLFNKRNAFSTSFVCTTFRRVLICANIMSINFFIFSACLFMLVLFSFNWSMFGLCAFTMFFIVLVFSTKAVTAV